MTERLPCKTCGESIHPDTAELNGGLCMPCKRGYRQQVDDGKRRRELEREGRLEEKPFSCPECGGHRAAGDIMVGVKYSGENPWSYVAARETCGDCGTEIPRSLSRRWNLETAEEARAIWIDKFRGVRGTTGST